MLVPAIEKPNESVIAGAAGAAEVEVDDVEVEEVEVEEVEVDMEED